MDHKGEFQMKLALTVFIAGMLAGLPAASAQQSFTIGGDQFTAGQNATIAAPVANDAFLAGYDVSLNAPVTGDAHVAGFNVTTGAGVDGDLYAAGFSVSVGSTLGGDLTTMGNTVTLRSPATMPGNARLLGQTVMVGSPIGGSLIATAQTLTLDAVVTGDFIFLGETLNFGTGAKVGGKLTIRAPRPIAVPESVASADRVVFEQVPMPDYMSEAGRTAEAAVKNVWPQVWAMIGWWVVLLAIGAAFIALMPKGVAALQTIAEKRPFRNLGVGLLAFASVIGLVPLVAITVIGIVLLPFVAIFIAIACSLAYLAGVYFTGTQIGKAFFRIDTNAQRLAVLAASIVIAALIGLIPFAGWLVSLGLTTFGFGVVAVVLMVRWSRDAAARLMTADAASAPARA
jgi:hypothetical protein